MPTNSLFSEYWVTFKVDWAFPHTSIAHKIIINSHLVYMRESSKFISNKDGLMVFECLVLSQLWYVQWRRASWHCSTGWLRCLYSVSDSSSMHTMPQDLVSKERALSKTTASGPDSKHLISSWSRNPLPPNQCCIYFLMGRTGKTAKTSLPSFWKRDIDLVQISVSGVDNGGFLLFIFIFLIWKLLSNCFPYNTQGSSQKVPSSIPITQPNLPATRHHP